MRAIISAMAGAVLFAGAQNAHALPGATIQIYENHTMLVSACGKGNHRNRQGQCVNGSAAAAAPTSSGASGMVCPPGTRLGTHGRNCRRID